MTYKHPEPVEPVENEHGDETHPAFGMLSAHRIRATPGVVLFDSDMRHGEYIEVTLTTATRKRELKSDSIFPGTTIFTVEMSLAQWAAFVSSTGTSGVPATIGFTQVAGRIPGIPYAPRLAVSMGEAKGAAEEAFGKILEAFEAYEAVLAAKGGAKDRAAALRNLKSAIANALANVAYAGDQFIKLTEDVVAKARADIEAMVNAQAASRGIDSAPLLELPAAE